MSTKHIETIISSGIKSMSLSHYPETLPYIFEILDLAEHYAFFDALEDYYIPDCGIGGYSYHGKEHCFAVALNCYEGMHSTELPYEKEEKRALMLAALYHDANHLRIVEDDKRNIAIAIQTLQEANEFARHPVDHKTLENAIKLIRYTTYPHISSSARIRNRSALVIRDADLMTSYEPQDRMVELIVGLYNEINDRRNYNGKAPLTLDTFLDMNNTLLGKIQWNTRWAKNKAFHYNFPQMIKNMRSAFVKRGLLTA